MSGELCIDKTVTSGVFTLDGGEWQVDNNVWVVGDDTEAYVIDAAHDAEAVLEAVGDRRLLGVICTHAHNDHIDAAPAVADRTGAPILLHPDDEVLWRMTLPDREPDVPLADGDELAIGDGVLKVLHTPGHSPGAVCLQLDALNTVFSGDTLFQGGPGATGRSYSDHPTIIKSIRTKLLTLSGDTVVRPGHGDSTTIAAEAPGILG